MPVQHRGSCPWPILLVATWMIAGCAPSGGDGEDADGGVPAELPMQGGSGPAAAHALERELADVDSAMEVVDEIFQPLPLLTPADEGALRSFSNTAQLTRARRFGVSRELPASAAEAHEREGRLVRLEDNRYWVIGELDHSEPLVVPETRDLLVEIGERFHARLADLGAPPFRFEISSLLRTAADQEALRAVNPNAALGESTHEYGTTVDILYSAFAAPEAPITGSAAEAEWLQSYVERYGRVAAERVAARRAMELKAVLGEVLLELQREGRVMVTLERQQPVFHMTLAGIP